jgi:hypothetical protein
MVTHFLCYARQACRIGKVLTLCAIKSVQSCLYHAPLKAARIPTARAAFAS